MDLVVGQPNRSIQFKQLNAVSTDENIVFVGHDDGMNIPSKHFFT